MVVVHLHNNNDDNNERRSFAAVRGIENGNRVRDAILTSATPANARANETLRNGGRVSGARTVVSVRRDTAAAAERTAYLRATDDVRRGARKRRDTRHENDEGPCRRTPREHVRRIFANAFPVSRRAAAT